MQNYRKSILYLFAAMITAAAPAAVHASQAESVEGVVLRVQDVRGGGESASRLLLSTNEGLCAVRVPGAAEEWESYVDAEIGISGVLEGMEFIVSSQADVHVLKYPPTDPDALIDILPAGELVQRRIRRQEEEREAVMRRRRMISYVSAGAAAALVFAVLAVFILRIRRKERFFRSRLQRERKINGKLHENIEQQLSGSRYLLEAALSWANGTPKEVSDTMTAVSETLSDLNRKVHRNATQKKSIEETRGNE